MLWCLTTLLFVSIDYCNSNAIVLNLDPSHQTYRIEPVDNQKTRFNISSPEGSKIVTSCKADVCDFNRIRLIYEDTDWVTCQEFIPRPTFSSNAITVELDPEGGVSVHCNVTATESYLKAIDISTESDEEGLPVDKKPTCACGWTNKDGGRVVGGKKALKNEYPFMVGVGYDDEPKPRCGGSIITPYHVLSAAHCVEAEYVNYRVFVGFSAFNETEENDHTDTIPVKRAFKHENYVSMATWFGSPYDIAVLFLEREISFNKWVGPVCMPKYTEVETDRYMKVLGWGVLHASHNVGSDYLMKADLRVIDLDVCDKMYPGSIVGNSQYCTYHMKKDACQGDSGGPLVMVNPETNMLTQHALVSFAEHCNGSFPAVNTKVIKYIGWIKAIVKKTKQANLCY